MSLGMYVTLERMIMKWLQPTRAKKLDMMLTVKYYCNAYSKVTKKKTLLRDAYS